MMFNLNSSDIIQLLDYGIIGVGIFLAVMMYNLLLKAQGKENPNIKLIKVLIFYFVLSISIFFLGGVVQIFEYFKKPSVSIEIKPTDSKFWRGNPKYFLWFNAEYKLAKDNFIELNADKINNGVIYHLLCFSGDEIQSHAISKEKFNRMREFLKKLSDKAQINENNVSVKIVPYSQMPSISFFNTIRNEEPVIIYYLEELIRADGVPTLAFEVNHEMVVKFFETEFAEFWEIGKSVSLHELLDEEMETDSILNRYR